MKKTKLMMAITPLLFVATTSVNAQIANQNSNINTLNSISAPAGGNVVLFDQISLPASNGAPDQNFEAAYDIYDSEVADDFVVPGPMDWNINRVNIVGTYSAAGPAVSVDIAIYPDNAGVPDAANPVAGCSFTGLPITTDTAGSFATDLPAGCLLTPGSYWMGHITNIDFAVGGQHFFSNTLTLANSEAHWVNPGDGFGTGCTTFTPGGSVCGIGGGAAFDLLYSLEGTESLPIPTAVPTMTMYGMALMILTLGFFGRRFVKNS
jgi:hypothetical protein